MRVFHNLAHISTDIDGTGKIYGIGHAIYTLSDPRAVLLKEKARELAVEKNRVDAISHSRFFTVMQAPYKPEDVGMPKRWYMTVTLLALGAIFFLMLRALTRSVFEGV